MSVTLPDSCSFLFLQLAPNMAFGLILGTRNWKYWSWLVIIQFPHCFHRLEENHFSFLLCYRFFPLSTHCFLVSGHHSSEIALDWDTDYYLKLTNPHVISQSVNPSFMGPSCSIWHMTTLSWNSTYLKPIFTHWALSPLSFNKCLMS